MPLLLITKHLRKILVAFVTIFCLAFIIKSFYNVHKYRENKNAAALYEKLTSFVQKNDLVAANTLSKKLTTKYKYTTYGLLANLLLAQQEVNNNNFTQAEKHLQAIVTTNRHSLFLPLVNLRLGRIYLQQNKSKELQQLIDTEIKNTPLKSFYYELRGDWAKSENNIKLAQESYQEAINTAISEQEKLLLATKLADLPV